MRAWVHSSVPTYRDAFNSKVCGRASARAARARACSATATRSRSMSTNATVVVVLDQHHGRVTIEAVFAVRLEKSGMCTLCLDPFEEMGPIRSVDEQYIYYAAKKAGKTRLLGFKYACQNGVAFYLERVHIG